MDGDQQSLWYVRERDPGRKRAVSPDGRYHADAQRSGDRVWKPALRVLDVASRWNVDDAAALLEQGLGRVADQRQASGYVSILDLGSRQQRSRRAWHSTQHL